MPVSIAQIDLHAKACVRQITTFGYGNTHFSRYRQARKRQNVRLRAQHKQFDPWGWIIVSVVFAMAGIAILIIAQYWRLFAKRAILAYDNANLYVGNDRNHIRSIPWASLDVESAGLKDPKSGADLKMTIDGESVRVRLFTAFVCIPHFDEVLAVILTHIQENAKAQRPSSKRSKS